MSWGDGQKALAVSLGLHLVLVGLFGMAGWKALKKAANDDKIYTVAIMSSGGPARKGNGNPVQGKPKASPEIRAAAPPEPKPAAPQIPQEETIPEDVKETPLQDAVSPAAPQSGRVPAAIQSAPGNNEGEPVGSPGGDPDGGDPNGSDSAGGDPGPGTEPAPSFDPDAVQPDVEPAELGHQNPAYPEPMRNRGITGRVTIQMVVGKDGSVESASVIGSSGYGLLDRAALDSAYSYSFSPAYKEGIPVRCYATKTVVFRL